MITNQRILLGGSVDPYKYYSYMSIMYEEEILEEATFNYHVYEFIMLKKDKDRLLEDQNAQINPQICFLAKLNLNQDEEMVDVILLSLNRLASITNKQQGSMLRIYNTTNSSIKLINSKPFYSNILPLDYHEGSKTITFIVSRIIFPKLQCIF